MALRPPSPLDGAVVQALLGPLSCGVRANLGVNVNTYGVILSAVSLFEFQAFTCQSAAIVLVIDLCELQPSQAKKKRKEKKLLTERVCPCVTEQRDRAGQ